MNVINISQKIDASDIPNGEYDASWCGYCVSFEMNGRTVEMTVNSGIRGRANCKVIASNGMVIVIKEDKA